MAGKLLVILGPTAVGKTDLALSLAKKFDGEIIACDSRQVYKGLDIGTGKLPGLETCEKRSAISKGEGFWIVDGVKIWMYDVADPKVQYTIKDYIERARQVIEDILKRGRLPILVGGSGHYIKGLLFGIDNLEVRVNIKLREELSALSVGELQNKLRDLSPTLFNSLNSSDVKNSRRLIRKIELVFMNPYMKTSRQVLAFSYQTWDALTIGLTAPRAIVNSSIDSRLDSRISQGSIEEAKRLSREGLSLKRMKELGLEYGVLADFIANPDCPTALKDCVEKMKVANHQYAKRQMTFFKKMENINWFSVTDANYPDSIVKMVKGWYN